MRTLFIDMPSGVAGDMLLAALIANGAPVQAIRRGLDDLGVGPIGVAAEPIHVGGLAALRVAIDAPQDPRWIQQIPAITMDLSQRRPADPATLAGSRHTPTSDPADAHGHRPYSAIRELLARSALGKRVKDRAQRSFRLLAEAEAAVHGADPETIEFHEVGSLDAIADVVGCCLALELLAIDRISASALTPGQGTVRCAHGLMPVPVPAVTEILRRTGAPCRMVGWDTGELTTPTGAALVCALADSFAGGNGIGSTTAAGRVISTGFGAGTKRIPGLVNAVRCTVLESAVDPTEHDEVVEIRANLDDATGEVLAVAVERLLGAGALDAWCEPLVMKKGRPGHLLAALCRSVDRQSLAELILRETPTIGLRWQLWQRQILPRRMATVSVDGHDIPLKIVSLPGGGERAKPEADAVAKAALALGRTFLEVQAAALAEAARSRP